MTPILFKELWTSVFPHPLSMQHFFKEDYRDRWFRIHSLPASKRYADTKEEWNILLDRQNTIITDLLGSDAKVILVTGDYNIGDPEDEHVTGKEPVFSGYVFTRLDDIELDKVNPDYYELGDVYRPAFAEIVWQPGAHNELLRYIANDEGRAFIVSFERIQIIAPYDGGIDIILADSASRDICRNKYKHWLSTLEGGL